MFGLFLFAVGIVFAVHCELGASPWDTLHLGLAARTKFSLGQISQIVGAFIILADIFLKQAPGRGTLLNMYFVGFFVDLVESSSLVPTVESFFGRVIMLFAGIFVIGWGTYFYLDAGWGAGPRDGLMLGLAKVFSAQVGKTRTVMEAAVAVAGLLLGAKLGFGTVANVLLLGPAVQFAYKVAGKEPKAIIHRTLMDDYRGVAAIWKKAADSRISKST